MKNKANQTIEKKNQANFTVLFLMMAKTSKFKLNQRIRYEAVINYYIRFQK